MTKKVTCVLALAILVMAGMSFAAENKKGVGGLASAMAGVKVTPVKPHLGHISPATNNTDIGPSSLVFPNSYYASGGCGLRNAKNCTIQVSGGEPNTISAAPFGVLYWAVLTDGAPSADFYRMTLRNQQNGLSATYIGTIVGQGSSPCWAPSNITVFRALISGGGPSGALFGGNYVATPVAPGAFVDNTSPWAPGRDLAPEWEGVSLILVFNGDPATYNGTVSIYDTGISGMTFGGPFGSAIEYVLVPPPSSSTLPVLFTNIGADGQVGFDYQALAEAVVEQLFINNVQVAGYTLSPPIGPFQDNDSDWNGNSAAPNPQLWDNRTHNIQNLGVTGPIITLDVVQTNAVADCITPVANVVLTTP
jgi:hypothetical protein